MLQTRGHYSTEKICVWKQDLEILKNCMFKTQQFENFGTHAPLARNHTYISILCYNLLIICVTNTRILVYRQNVRLTNKTLRSWRIVRFKTHNLKMSGLLAPLACIIYEISQVSTLMIKAKSWVLRITCGFD